MKPQCGKCCSKPFKLDPYTDQFHPNSVMLLTMRQLWKSAAAHNRSIRSTLDSATCFFGMLEIPWFCGHLCHSWGAEYSPLPAIFKWSPLQSCLLMSWRAASRASFACMVKYMHLASFFQMDPGNHSCKNPPGGKRRRSQGRTALCGSGFKSQLCSCLCRWLLLSRVGRHCLLAQRASG